MVTAIMVEYTKRRLTTSVKVPLANLEMTHLKKIKLRYRKTQEYYPTKWSNTLKQFVCVSESKKCYFSENFAYILSE